jgi:hypothetical protein
MSYIADDCKTSFLKMQCWACDALFGREAQCWSSGFSLRKWRSRAERLPVAIESGVATQNYHDGQPAQAKA